MSKLSLILTKDMLQREYVINKKSILTIGKECDCSEGSVWKYLKKYHITTRSKYKYKTPPKKVLYKEYIINKKSTNTIAKEYKCSSDTVYQHLKRYNIKIRNISDSTKKYKSDIQQLSNINYATVYVLGFLCADGCLYKIGNYYGLAVGLKHEKENESLLTYIKQIIHSNNPISYRKPFNKTTNKHYQECRIQIYGLSEKDAILLRKLGIFERKSCKEFMPNLPIKYQFSWLRGFFDGDGWVSIKSKKQSNNYYCSLGFCSGDIKILKQIQNLCFRYGSVSKIRNKNVAYLIMGKKDHIKHIVKLMYANDTFSLKRKKNRFIEHGLL